MGGSQRQSGLRRGATVIASGLAAGAALWFALRGFEWSTFTAQSRALDWRWIAAAVCADVVSYVFQAVRWSWLLQPVAPVSILQAARAIYAGLFVNEVLPMRPGEILRGLIIARGSGQPASRILPSMVAERLMDSGILIVATLCTAVFVPLPGPVASFLKICAAVLVVAFAYLAFSGRRIPPSWQEPLRHRGALAISLLPLLGQCVAVWCALRACGLPIGLLAACAITVILRVGTALPLAPANVGTHQLALVLGLTLFGVARIQAASTALIVFAVLTLPLLLLGAACLGSGLAYNGQRSGGMAEWFKAAVLKTAVVVRQP